MSIEREYNSFILVCDNCGESLGKKFNNFHEAAEAKKENGWKSKRIDGQWEDWCDECCKNK